MHGLQEGREEQKREKKKGAIPEVSEKGPNNQTSTPESTKKATKIKQNGAKIDPKWSQNEAKTNKKSEQRFGKRFPRAFIPENKESVDPSVVSSEPVAEGLDT